MRSTPFWRIWEGPVRAMPPEDRAQASLPGTRPAGALDDAAAARQVREMFSRIAPRYDLLNHLLSLRFDTAWRRRVARRFADLLAQPGIRVLDLCCGTGDLTFALASQARFRVPQNSGGAGETSRQGKQFLGADFAHPMLIRAREKAAANGRQGTVEFLEADALHLPFASESFDLITTAFGFRNLANYAAGITELRRVLRPGGSLAILEFAEPQGALFGRLFRFYFRRVLPKIGGLISRNSQAYGYLPNSVARFPHPAELAQLLLDAGFAEVAFERWTGGIVVLHVARR
jgi:demethylmenaquinone methyltransferase / 2-methoxy-6-polyprenyl-1,4-benzoquinol methylase